MFDPDFTKHLKYAVWTALASDRKAAALEMGVNDICCQLGITAIDETSLTPSTSRRFIWRKTLTRSISRRRWHRSLSPVSAAGHVAATPRLSLRAPECFWTAQKAERSESEEAENGK